MSVVSRGAPLNRLAELTRAIAKVTAPMSRPLAGRRFFPLWAVLRHRGRRSGREYEIPVAVRVSPVAFVIALPWGDQTQWVRNVVAAGGCSIRWRGANHPVTEPRVVNMEEVATAFSPFQRWVLRTAGVSRFLHLRRAVQLGDASHRLHRHPRR